ncbi:baseplate assembly protein [Nitratidesulfovibrio vulgaris]|uniref:Baseplate assembly protein, putative n=1 Tax=Nitratidesulfovibrio vulgaris (strain ATCC 29579 / DSM 644 / CCUG 34227 / NCIMB 8303 / VKM B-1760 / Hildenborough) TaxID=882 RepID=Q72D27_NITV2|nr:baseplate assembly protein [Nitratidesulfovibrio vulgaris]AAS95584.1 baseplate assembly protein, putative [Nitratidesulfovibrio vulgaris str. Hildenborough]ADP86187.1 baseplate assembly protein, putative [Nitratidesulfovibrio vulgaris RCH1]
MAGPSNGGNGGTANLLQLIRRAVELAMPDFRHYYRMTRKARVVAAYASDGRYYADVQPLRNDESDDPAEPVVPRVELPVLWGGPERGVVCPPVVGTLCDLSYYDGDPNYPRIGNIRWQGHGAPLAEVGEFVIQLEKGVEMRIDTGKRIVSMTPADWLVQVGGNATVQAEGSITLQAPQIIQRGNVTGEGHNGGKGTVSEHADRTITGSLTINGPVAINGGLSVDGDSTVSGNSHAGSRSGGII